MLWCGGAFAAVAVATLGLLLLPPEEAGGQHAEGAASFFGRLTLGGVARPVDALLMSGLCAYGAAPFGRAARSERRQLPYAFQGLNHLTLVFEQLRIASAAVACVSSLEAAARWPPTAALASAGFFGYALLRSGSMWWVLTAHAARLDDVEATLAAYRAELAALEAELAALKVAAEAAPPGKRSRS